jgi:regulatory protein
MMLSAAEPRKRGLTALYADGEFAASLDTETWLKSGLHIGDDVTEEQLRQLFLESETRLAEQKAFRLLGFRPHSQKELEQKLRQKYSVEASERAARRVADMGLIDDAEYARSLARSLFGRKGFAAFRVKQELLRRGVSRELAEQAVEEEEPDPKEEIRRVVRKKYACCLDDEKGRRRAAAGLRRLGYRWDDINGALREFISDEEE